MKTILMSIVVVFLIGCSDTIKSEGDLKQDSINFYVLMLQTGEQTEKLDEVFHEFLKYAAHDDELYLNTVKMYLGLGDPHIPIETYRQEITRLINE